MYRQVNVVIQATWGWGGGVVVVTHEIKCKSNYEIFTQSAFVYISASKTCAKKTCRKIMQLLSLCTIKFTYVSKKLMVMSFDTTSASESCKLAKKLQLQAGNTGHL